MSANTTDKILFFGTLGVFSHAVLDSLLNNQANIVGVVISGSEPAHSMSGKYFHIPVLQQPRHDTIELLAIKNDIPIHYLHDINSERAINRLSGISFDFILIACFPQILSAQIIAMPTTAALNLHPSLLPEYRGASPLFWQLKNGSGQFGITLHLLSPAVDSGNILLQEECVLVDGMRGRAIDAVLGELGGRLFIKAASLYAQKRIVQKIQDPSRASYQPPPRIADFEISTDWTARRAFNFMRGTSEWEQPYRIVIDDQRFLIEGAIAWSPAATIKELFQIDGNVITIKFSQGLLKAGLKET